MKLCSDSGVWACSGQTTGSELLNDIGDWITITCEVVLSRSQRSIHSCAIDLKFSGKNEVMSE